MEKIINFRDLEIWKLGKDIVFSIYKMTKRFPKDEMFGLTAQLRRAAVSIPSNIAEGFNRFHNAEYRHFLFIALGSCAELETQVEVSADMQYISNAECKVLLEKLDHETRMLRNLIKKLDQNTPVSSKTLHASRFTLHVLSFLLASHLAYAVPVDVVIKGERKQEALAEKLTPSTTVPTGDIFPLGLQESDPLLHIPPAQVIQSTGSPIQLKSKMPLSPYLPEIPSQSVAKFYPPNREKTEFWHLKLADSHGQVIQEWFARSTPPEVIPWDGKDRSGQKRLVRVGDHYSFLYDARLLPTPGQDQPNTQKISKVFQVKALLEESEGRAVISLASTVLLDKDNALTPEGRDWLKSACDEAKKRHGRKLTLIWSAREEANASQNLSTLATAFQEELQLKPDQLKTTTEKSFADPPVVKFLLEKEVKEVKEAKQKT